MSALPRSSDTGRPTSSSASISTPAAAEVAARTRGHGKQADRRRQVVPPGIDGPRRSAARRIRGCRSSTTDAAAISHGTTRFEHPARGASRSRAAPVAPPSSTTTARTGARRVLPGELGPAAQRRADRGGGERDGVGDVGGQRGKAGGEQRRVGEQRRQPGDGAGQPGGEPRDEQQEHLADAHRRAPLRLPTGRTA